MQSSGGAETLSNGLLYIASGASPAVILTIMLLITMLLSAVLNNVATVLVAAPIGFEVAKILSVNPDTFLMAVAIGASCAFLTPIGHQNNTLVMGPGGYRFNDYWKLGLPLEIIIDRKSTRLNSSHVVISYAVFCLKKKKQKQTSPVPAWIIDLFTSLCQ